MKQLTSDIDTDRETLVFSRARNLFSLFTPCIFSQLPFKNKIQYCQFDILSGYDIAENKLPLPYLHIELYAMFGILLTLYLHRMSYYDMTDIWCCNV